MEEIKDEDFKKELWKGSIPVVFNLHQNDITTLHTPPPFYMMVPRGSYFPFLTSAVHSHFISSTAVIVDELWLDYKGKPLKWHYPIGVLYDLLCGSLELPWNLTAHLQGFPQDQVIRFSNEAALKAHFMNMLKETTFVKHGDCSRLNDLSVLGTNDLWDGLKNNEYDKFWKSNGKLQDDFHTLKRIPIRLFHHGQPTSCYQAPVTPTDEKGATKTLGDVLHELLPQEYPDNSFAPSFPPVLIQGVTPSLHSPITWLSENMSHPDNFL